MITDRIGSAQSAEARVAAGSPWAVVGAAIGMP